MANCTNTTAKIVSKDKNVLEKLKAIFKSEDKDYCLYQCNGECYLEETKDGIYTAYFDITSNWNCEPMFNATEKPYNGKTLTNLVILAKKLGFGVELYSTEGGDCLAEHYGVDHNGEITYWETSEYKEIYPLDENGEPDYEKEPTIECDFEINDFSNALEIYGE
jgi:hypothetical protein